MGLSFGAPLALRVGIELGARTVTPIGLRKNPAALAADMPLWWKTLRDNAAKPPPTARPGSLIQFVYGELDDDDSAVAAKFLRILTGAKSIAILGGGHSPLGHLFRQGELAAFLSLAINGFPDGASSPALRLDDR
jgi:hypothetical protein